MTLNYRLGAGLLLAGAMAQSPFAVTAQQSSGGRASAYRTRGKREICAPEQGADSTSSKRCAA